MRILYICPRIPYPPDQGDALVVYSQLKNLSKANDITLLTMITDESELKGLEHLRALCKSVEVFRRRNKFSITNIVMALMRRTPYTAMRYYSPKMFKRSKELIESSGFDVVHALFYYMAQYVLDNRIKIPAKTATVFNAPNLECIIYSRYAHFSHNLFVKFFVSLEASRKKRYERELFNKSDCVLVFSEIDKERVADLSRDAYIRVNPLSMEAKPYKNAETKEEKNSMLFFGALNTLPNSDAIRYFYEEILPLIKKDVPDVKFVIAGKSASKYVLDIAKDPCVKFMGFVSDIRELLDSVNFVIAPLRIGGGIRLKILESWYAKKAVISTSAGAEGLTCKDGEDILIADNPVDFKNAVTSLIKNEELRNKISSSGLSRVKECYDPQNITRDLEEIYKDALNKKLKTETKS